MRPWQKRLVGASVTGAVFTLLAALPSFSEEAGYLLIIANMPAIFFTVVVGESLNSRALLFPAVFIQWALFAYIFLLFFWRGDAQQGTPADPPRPAGSAGG
jgi:hypothetical protein